MASIDARLIDRLMRQSTAARWGLAREAFAAALARSVAHAPAAAAANLERYCSSLHLNDLALACACATGDPTAWDEFVREYRPVLYRAADAIDPSGGARDLADSLYAELYGLREHDGARQSLFEYFHGRSSLRTWLRAILTQRHVDRVRVARRLDPLPEDEPVAASARASSSPNPDRPRFVALIQLALAASLAQLDPRDRLMLGCYYAQAMTLAQIGRMLGEHEATVSRRLTKTRRAVREKIEAALRAEGLGTQEIEECVASVAADPGPIDLAELLPTPDARKEFAVDRSHHEGTA